ncbi:hypothetical protein M011DRAFT_468308 [Sporormia fimetaria CBS 119925]|uniref:Uncharacterized protein n=1 Tax=Sporormia fimetaria CBS 119925 TaxID=1340428 RepID=A0A6A6VA78_9PLEO|nr:hypothetical protein M011DRAFT_468308 [Sporormia fimetaria CBS 119925]
MGVEQRGGLGGKDAGGKEGKEGSEGVGRKILNPTAPMFSPTAPMFSPTAKMFKPNLAGENEGDSPDVGERKEVEAEIEGYDADTEGGGRVKTGQGKEKGESKSDIGVGAQDEETKVCCRSFFLWGRRER